jgi:hypothetical protein
VLLSEKYFLITPKPVRRQAALSAARRKDLSRGNLHNQQRLTIVIFIIK